MLRPTPGDPSGVEEHHWDTGAEENQQLYKLHYVPIYICKPTEYKLHYVPKYICK